MESRMVDMAPGVEFRADAINVEIWPTFARGR
jgi:hypothetical protein